jgi:hypothetical protein
MLRIPSEDPRITVDNDLESDQIEIFGPELPVFERARREVTSMNATQYYFQPSLVALIDEPELKLAKGKMPKKERWPEAIPMEELGADKGKEINDKDKDKDKDNDNKEKDEGKSTL